MKTNKENTQLSFNFEQRISNKEKAQIVTKKISIRSFDEARRNMITQKILNNTKSF